MGWLPLSEEPHPPQRNNLGTLGHRIRLTSNFFEVAFKCPKKKIVQYDVIIREAMGKAQGEIPKLPKKKKMLIFETMKTTYHRVFKDVPLAFDSEKNAYSLSVIPQFKQKVNFDFKVEIEEESGKKREFIININVVKESNLQDLMKIFHYTMDPQDRKAPLSIFQALEVMFGHFSSLRFERVGKNTFFPVDGEFGRPSDIGGGKERITGFFSSLRPAAWKNGSLFLNIDVANTAFYKEQSVMEFIKEVLNLVDQDFHRPLDPAKVKKLKREMTNLKVQATHSYQPRTYKVRDIGKLSADRQTFPLTDPETNKTEEVTVANYFLSRYQMHLLYPRFNCLAVGSVQRNSYIPVECCKIVKGQKVQKRLNEAELSQIIRSAAKPPFERMNSVKQISKTCNFSSDPFMRALEFTVSDEPISFDGRVLPAPKVLMNEESLPKQGVWDYRNHCFFNGAELSRWAVVNYDPRNVNTATMMDFLGMLQRMGKERGMKISTPLGLKDFPNPQPERDFQVLKKHFGNVQLVLVVLPKYGDYYCRVKKIGDREVNIITQCVQSMNVVKSGAPLVGNILLKINAKIGGTNNVLGANSRPVVFNSPVMIMGADVNHPPAGDSSTPSLAAVVGSLDRYACKYAVEVRHQKHRTEVIQQLKDMTKNLLKAFYHATKRKPERIIMYRDGVSESQFPEVLLYEMKAMRQACSELETNYQPAITFLVVQKRHHTRLFCSEREGIGKSKNVPPGTTVDTTITHPTERDFYLCSHQGIQGTSRPTHYHVLWDDSDFNMDQLQSLTYAMCHLYSRCSRSVSIPAPAYYAHLAAFRAKVHIQDLCGSDGNSTTSGSEEPSDAILTQAVRIERGQDMHETLYYI